MKDLSGIPGAKLVLADGRTRVATLAAAPGSVYGERIVDGYRIWDPTRSKLAAFILKSLDMGIKPELGLTRSSKVLYLGAATGTTVSHVSDLVPDGLVYAVEFSPRSVRDLLRLCDARKNIIPILADASKPESYSALVETVDLVYQDVAQKNQSLIATANSLRYLLPGGTLLLMIKARSVDVTLSPEEVYQREIEDLSGLDVLRTADLLPYHRDHMAVQAKRKVI
jgi:fibrillarin-like pre-rRNA processing protein